MLKNSVVKLPCRKLVQVNGKDASRFLQGILTNDINHLKERSSMYAGFLTAKGRILGDCNVIRVNEESFWIDYDASCKETFQNHWKRYKLRMRVSFEDRSEQYNVVALLPALYSYQELRKTSLLHQVACIEELKSAYLNNPIAFTDPRGSVFGVRLIVENNDKVAIPDAFESTDATAFNNRRIYLGAAEGSELHDLIPLEANLDVLGGVSFSKGCYVGQELMARTHFKGLVRKRIIPCAIYPVRDQSMQSEKVEATFTNIDDNAATSLREYLLTTPVPTDQNAVQRGVKIICTETSKPIGSIITTAPGIRAALAMIRLEHLSIHGTRNAHIGQYTTSDGKFNLVPYQPVWWERLDSSSGKIMMTSN